METEGKPKTTQPCQPCHLLHCPLHNQPFIVGFVAIQLANQSTAYGIQIVQYKELFLSICPRIRTIAQEWWRFDG